MNKRNVSGFLVFLMTVITLCFVSSTAMAFVLSNTKAGGDCSKIGLWNAKTKTCTLTRDLYHYESNVMIDNNKVIVLIDGGGITFDANGHSVIGSGLDMEIGIYIAQRGVTVKNATVTGCAYGIFLTGAVRNKISGNTLSNNMYGVSITTNSNNNTINSNTVTYNNFAGIFLGNTANGNNIFTNAVMNNGYGICLFDSSSNNSITGNSVSHNSNGVFVNYLSNNNLITENTFSANLTGVEFRNAAENNIVHRNNFIDDSAVSYDSVNIFYLSTGGNYWSSFDQPIEGCTDANNDGFCDQPYAAAGVVDNLPWTTQDGWK